MALAIALLCSAGAWAQTDVTSTYITNAGFDESGDFQTGNVATGNSNQRKAVTGWTNSGGNTYSTGAAIGFGTSGQINGANLPSTNADGGTTGGALCLNAAWKSQVWYSQEITVPAGNYTFKFQVNNVGKNEQWNNDPPLFTFTTSLNTFSGNVNSYPLNTWTEQTISCSLASETTGTIKIGYKANDTGSGNTPKFVVDYVKAFYNSNYTATLQSAIDRATKLYTRTSDSDLNSAIAAAQAVLDGAGTDFAYQATIDGAVTTLRSAITDAYAKLTLEGEEDITYFLENANFESSPALTGGVCTYAYDCATNGVFYSQMQQVEGWTVAANGNGKAAGVLAYGSNTWIGGSSYKATSVTSSIGESNALALVSAWSATVQYKQNVTLPAGVYALTVPVFNSNGGTAISKNLIGFIEDGGTEHLATTTSYPVGSTKTETINFTLEAETSGYISLGYTAANTGSGNMPKMFIDAITIKYFTADKSELFDKLAEAQTYQDVLDDDDLAAAITTAQAVYDNGSALQSAVDAQVMALTTAIATALENIANGTNVTTLFIKNNSFEEGGDNWTFNSADDTGVKENTGVYATTGTDGTKLFNTWGGSSDKYVKQTLTGLPDGYYVISALVASEEGSSVTLYAGEGTNTVPVSYTGKGLFIEGKGGAVQPSEGSLEIGATSTNWYKADKFQLFYYDNEADALAAISTSNLTNAVANYNLVLTDAKSLSNPSITGKEKVDLDAAIAADDALDKSDIDAVLAAYETLKSAITAFNGAADAYERAAYAIEKATEASVDATALSTLKSAATTTAADLTDPTNELLADVINSYAPGEFGFDDGEYAPYNNVGGMELIADADNVASMTTSQITTTITGLKDATWTANAGEVNAFYDGNFAIQDEHTTGPTALTGWSNPDGIRQLIKDTSSYPGLTSASGEAAVFAWGNTNMTYGGTEGYTMPLNAHTIYELSFKTCGWSDGDMGYVNVDIKNASNEGLQTVATETAKKRITESEPWNEFRILFATGEAGNYTFGMWTSKHTTFTDLSLVKAASQTLTFAEDGTTPKYAAGTYPTVALDRTFSTEKRSTMVLPFAMDADETTAAFEEAYELTGVVGESIRFTAAPEIAAGKPYLVKAKNATLSVTNKSLDPSTEVSNTRVEDASSTVTFVGLFAPTTLTAESNDNAYIVSNNKLYHVASDINMAAYRGYFTVDSKGAEVKNFVLSFDDDATAINAVKVALDDNAEIYNLAGQKMSKLQKGVNIVNGKKILVK